jgi:hypothetical protein
VNRLIESTVLLKKFKNPQNFKRMRLLYRLLLERVEESESEKRELILIGVMNGCKEPPIHRQKH